MFTGIIEERGVFVKAVDTGTPDSPSQRVTIDCATVMEGTRLGDSIAVNGVCLTVVEILPHGFSADIMHETLRLTTLGKLSPGCAVNLERAIAIGDRLGGHMVQGHVDTTGDITAISPEHVVRISLSPEILRFVAYKGSITLNGVSLTVSAVGDTWLEVSLIPETLARTTFGEAHVGDAVNVEVDAIAKYVDHLLSPYK